MTKLMVVVAGVEREMNEAELAQYEIDKGARQREREAEAKAEADKAALLTKLGISADEAKLLLS